ncbi:MAG: DUF1702 family protein, partial [Candidatus Zixiibacteriota bacterium]
PPRKRITVNERMRHLAGRLRRIVFGISQREALFSRRGFFARTSEARAHLEQVGATFIAGYNAALEETDATSLMPVLNQNERELTGFAFEGAAMALALLDLITPWNRTRIDKYLEVAGAQHVYMIHIGAGWALARLRRSIESYLKRRHPVYRWLVVDGYGFHQGYFHWKRFIESRKLPIKMSGYALRAFDQGLGRALWFMYGADVEQVSSSVRSFAAHRQPELWSGVGLACAYAGKVSLPEIRRLRTAAGQYYPQLAQGAAFAAKARLRAENLTEYTDQVCQELCGISAVEAANLTDRALENLPTESEEPAYQVWRSRLHSMFAMSEPGKVRS